MKKTKRPKLGPTLDERERQIQDDYEWCLDNQDVQEKYGGKIVIVHKRKIWGVGTSHALAWAAAQRKHGCPAREHIAVVVVPYRRPARTRR
jgi:hypothetical protein